MGVKIQIKQIFALSLLSYLRHNTMKKFFLFLFVSLFFLPLKSQNKGERLYEVTRNMPSFYDKVKQQLTYPMAWGNATEKNFSRWRTEARKVLMECMQNRPPTPDTYNLEIVGTEKRRGYEARKILFNVSGWSRIPAYLLVPEGKGPFPAIVMLHDHGAHFTIGKEKMVRPFNVSPEVTADADDWAGKCYDGQYTGDYFAAHGYVVLTIDALFWGERGQKEGADYNGQQALASNLLQMGTSWGSVITMDDVRSTDFLATLPEVDPEKIGTLGFSMGAYRAWMLSAATDRIKASAAICWMNTTDSLMTLSNNQNKGGSAYSMIVPGIRRFMDYPHVASIACPKPSLFFNGTKDKLFPVAGVQSAYDTMHQVWSSQKADDRLVTKLWGEKHFFNKEMQRETLLFFDKWLK
jgi:dienelactone hydrolase